MVVYGGVWWCMVVNGCNSHAGTNLQTPDQQNPKQQTLHTLADAAAAAAAAAAATNAVQMLTPAISSKEERTQRNHLVADCQSFPADLKCRLSFLMMNMIRALNQHATDPHIEQFQMGYCNSGCNILKQRCVMWCWWRCTDACGGVCILYVVVVYGCIWWCMYSLCGGGGVRMHVVVYGCVWWCMYSLCGGGGVRMHVVVYGCMWWCTDACGGVRDACGGVCILDEVVAVYGCVWWCMYSLCGGGGVRMHVVVYGCMWWCTDACGGVRMHVVVYVFLMRWWRCTDACGGVCILYVVVAVCGCMWWCTDACGGVRMHVVVYGCMWWCMYS
jgi:hypothetical protein